jgi:Protein of unknown function (DUF3604)
MPADKKAPSFAVWAVRDPTSGNLDRIQIVKGWTKNGQSFLSLRSQLNDKAKEYAVSVGGQLIADSAIRLSLREIPVDLRQSADASSGSSVCRRKATMIASSLMERTVDLASLGPVGRSAAVSRCFHFATVFWLIALGEGSQALLTILYCSTDCLRRGGAAV